MFHKHEPMQSINFIAIELSLSRLKFHNSITNSAKVTMVNTNQFFFRLP